MDVLLGRWASVTPAAASRAMQLKRMMTMMNMTTIGYSYTIKVKLEFTERGDKSQADCLWKKS